MEVLRETSGNLAMQEKKRKEKQYCDCIEGNCSSQTKNRMLPQKTNISNTGKIMLSLLKFRDVIKFTFKYSNVNM